MDEKITSTQVLLEALLEQNDPRLTDIINKARRQYYNEFRSDLAAPIMALVADLRGVGCEELAQRAIEGEFDATEAESQAWVQSDEGQKIFAELLGAKKPARKRSTGV